MMYNINESFLNGWFWEKNLNMIYPKINNKEDARKLADIVKGAIGIFEFIDDDGKYKYGILCTDDEELIKNYDNM